MWIFLSFALGAPPAIPPQCDPDDAESCVQPLLEGESAPFSGQLLSPRRAAKLAVLAGNADERARLAVEEAEEVWRVKLEAERRLRVNDNAANRLKVEMLERASARPFYEHPLFVAAVTVAGCVAVYFLALETVKLGAPD